MAKYMRMKFGSYVLSDDFNCLCVSRPLPEFRPTATQVDGADGSVFDEMTLGTRGFTIRLVSRAGQTRKERHEAVTKLARALLVREPTRFIFTDENDPSGNQLYRMAVPTGAVDVEEFVRNGTWTVEFVQHNPYLYGKENTLVLKANQSAKVKVGGNANAYPLLTAKPTGDTYWLKDNNGNWLKFGGPFKNSTLHGNFAKLTLKLDPSVSGAKGLLAGSVFFDFEGTMHVKASHKTTLTWRERWIR